MLRGFFGVSVKVKVKVKVKVIQYSVEPTLKSKACFRCLFITKIISG